jgi:hypothetical protein
MGIVFNIKIKCKFTFLLLFYKLDKYLNKYNKMLTEDKVYLLMQRVKYNKIEF